MIQTFVDPQRSPKVKVVMRKPGAIAEDGRYYVLFCAEYLPGKTYAGTFTYSVKPRLSQVVRFIQSQLMEQGMVA